METVNAISPATAGKTNQASPLNPIGTGGGTPFDDYKEHNGDLTAIRTFMINYNSDGIFAIQFGYDTVQGYVLGDLHGRIYDHESFASSAFTGYEKVVGLGVFFAPDNGTLKQLEIITYNSATGKNKTYGPYGGENWGPKLSYLEAPANTQMVALFGKADTQIAQIGAYVM